MAAGDLFNYYLGYSILVIVITPLVFFLTEIAYRSIISEIIVALAYKTVLIWGFYVYNMHVADSELYYTDNIWNLIFWQILGLVIELLFLYGSIALLVVLADNTI